jgi:hypothetical protein
MTDTYRIKPLVWKVYPATKIKPEFHGASAAMTVGVQSYGNSEGFFWFVGNDPDYRDDFPDPVCEHGKADTLEAAKSAAEAAYRDLLLAALEPVETPAVSQNQS